jgi:hypothetical protein
VAAAPGIGRETTAPPDVLTARVTRCEDVDVSGCKLRFEADRDRRARTRPAERQHVYQRRRRQATGVTTEIYLILLGHQTILETGYAQEAPFGAPEGRAEVAVRWLASPS